jgi:hypothetical protein
MDTVQESDDLIAGTSLDSERIVGHLETVSQKVG